MEILGYNMPVDLYYEEHHYWVRMEGDILVMGMDDFSRQLAGEIVYVQLPNEGKRLKIGKKFAKVESGKWLGKVFAPIDGVLESANEELEENPGLINEDCYGRGWMYKIRPADGASLDHLITGEQALEKWLEAEVKKYADNE